MGKQTMIYPYHETLLTIEENDILINATIPEDLIM